MKYDRNVYRSLIMISQFGLTMIVPILLCTFAGDFIDKKLGTSFIVVIFFFIGALAGFRNVYVLVKKMGKDEGERDEKTKRHQ